MACTLVITAALAACAPTYDVNKYGSPTVSMKHEIFAWRRGDPRYIYGGSSKTAPTSREPSAMDQRSLLKLAQSDEVQIAALCWMRNGKFFDCSHLQTIPDAPQVKRATISLLRKFEVERRVPARTPIPNYAMINIWITKEDVDLGSSGRCILLMCGVPTPPPPKPPAEPKGSGVSATQ